VTRLDWTIVAGYFLASAAIGLAYARRAGRSVEEFFLSGRRLPWWLAGTSMVATTFAADTPLAVTELVARHGIAGNWLWWNMAAGGVATVVFFARLWRRAGVLTDVEFLERRYSGAPAAWLRGLRAVYLGLFANSLIIGWVNLAMASVLEGLLGVPAAQVLAWVAGALVVTALYAAVSGLWGVAVTDAFQFVLAMAGTTALAVVVVSVPAVGGLAGLRAALPDWALRMTPVVGGGGSAPATAGAATGLALTLPAFLAFAGVQWWASWYPGAEPGGGGYIAQRMMSAKDERHAVFATLWFTIAHYCVRPWPWILVALATLVLYPGLAPEAQRLGYVYAMRDFLPPGLKGVLVAAFFAAYMSTVATQLNWGTSYLVHDLYRRFARPAAGERELVAASRLTTVVLMVVSLAVTRALDTVSGAWALLIEAGAGLGLVLILRWYWWRVNAWSEITAMLVPLVVSAGLRWRTALAFPESLYVIVGVTTVAWVAVTLATPPVATDTLCAFYRRVRPGGPGWRPIAQRCPEVVPDAGFAWLFVDWAAGVALVYSVLFASGAAIFGAWRRALALAAVAAVATLALAWRLGRTTRG
jgi:SSS family solute:Na+ symporter